MESLPLISVVMCTYNGELFLEEQLESIVNQTYKNIEIIIVDDVSTDKTIDIINTWKAKDERIMLYQNSSNLGYNKNFENAIKYAKGEFIALSDQDDIWFVYKLERLFKLFATDDIILTHGRSVKLIDGELHFPLGKLLPTFTSNDPKKLFYDNQISGHKIMFRRSLVSKISPIPHNMFYDWWIGVLATCNGYIKGSEEYLVKYRIHGANSHINVKKEVKANHIDHITAWEYFLQIKDMKEEDKDFLRSMIKILKQHREKKRAFDPKLFFFLLKNRKIIFANRRKLTHDFLYLKFVFYYAITSFK